MLRRLAVGLFILACAGAAAACSSSTATPSSGGVPGIGPNFSTNTLYVINQSQNAVEIFLPSPASGAKPKYLIGGGNTQLNGPQYDTFDNKKLLFVTNYNAGTQAASLNVYAEFATGNVLPLFTTRSGLSQPHGIATLQNNTGFAVANTNPGGFFPSAVLLYGPSIGGSVSFVNLIAGYLTKLNVPWGVAVNSKSLIYVANRGNGTITAYATPTPGPSPTTSPSPSPSPTTSPSGSPSPSPTPVSFNEPPALTIAGPNTGLVAPTGIAIDSSDRVYVVDPDSGSPSIRVFAANAAGNAAPAFVIAGPATQLTNPLDVKVDSAGNIYVTDSGNGVTVPSKLLIFAPSARNNTAPAVSISLPFTVGGVALSP